MKKSILSILLELKGERMLMEAEFIYIIAQKVEKIHHIIIKEI